MRKKARAWDRVKEKEYKAHLDALKQKEAFSEQKKFDDSLKSTINERLRVEKSRLRAELTSQIKQTITSEQSTAMENVRRARAKKRASKELNASKIEIEKLRNERKKKLLQGQGVRAQLELSRELCKWKREDNKARYKETMS